MAKSNAPLFGIDASGAIGDTLVYSKWKGIKYARRYVVPSNPRTEAQLAVRSVFRFLNQVWANAPALLKEPWEAYATGRNLTDRNAFIGFNVASLRELTNLNGFVASPGVLGGYPLMGISATGGSRSLTASVTVPQLPSGWSVAGVTFVILRQQDPHSDFLGLIRAQQDTSSPYQVVFDNLQSGQYVVTAFAVYQRPDGKRAFSPSLITSATVS
ncbi:hypothetical protein [Thermoflexus sp.]|uniref:hypothetical protein n=1 Tax=Thermoflexus sp. TaxID=1969742 RepID=UPI002ADE38A2|nr:hypothetical protein [Thermoflexus sp.]